MANGGGTYVRKDGRTDGRLEIPPCVLQDIGPLGPLPKKDRKKRKDNDDDDDDDDGDNDS